MAHPMTTTTAPRHAEEECEVYVTVDPRAVILDRFDGPDVAWLRGHRGGDAAAPLRRPAPPRAPAAAVAPRPRWPRDTAK